MKNFSDNNEWFTIRRKLAAALKNSEKIKITGLKKFLDDRNEFIPVLDDIMKFSAENGIAEISFENDDLVFNPGKISSDSYKYESGNFSSITELLLYILPAIACGNSKTVLNISGVTNSSVSYPAVFLKEVMFRKLSEKGVSIDINTASLGFYARAGGDVKVSIPGTEYKIISGEKAEIPDEKKLSSKILISGIDSTLALSERDLIEKVFPELAGSGIMEVASPGLANWIYLYYESNSQLMIFFREIPFYNNAGDLIFDYDCIEPLIAELRAEFDAFISSGMLPWDLDAEMAVFA